MSSKAPKRKPRAPGERRLGAAAQSLVDLAKGFATSGGRLEDRLWENRLAAAIDPLLEHGAEDDLNAALDALFDANADAHDDLADLIESRAEATTLTHQGVTYDVLLVAAPLLAWSRFSIPSGSLPKSTQQALATQFQAHLLAAGAHFALADFLYSPDQLPRSYTDTWTLLRELGVAALGGRHVRIDTRGMPETNAFLSDSRYLLGAVAVPQAAPLFRWNEKDGQRDGAVAAWTAQATPSFEPLLTGCAFKLLGADAYHAACRLADTESRPYSLEASVAFLQAQAGIEPAALQAVIGGFHEEQLEEYRVGLGPLANGELIYHGVVWPLLGAEDENTDVPGEITRALNALGVTQVRVLDTRFPFEFCDDCGAPMYANADGEPTHAELPDAAESSPRTLH